MPFSQYLVIFLYLLTFSPFLPVKKIGFTTHLMTLNKNVKIFFYLAQNWKSYQHFFEMTQADSSTRRVLGLDIEHIYQDLAARADEILTRHSTDEVHLMNRSGHMAYTWVNTFSYNRIYCFCKWTFNFD